MPNVKITGTFMNAYLKPNFDKTQTHLYIDIYQSDSTDAEKTVSIKSEDVTLITEIQKKYQLGSEVTATASINAYKNKAYYKLLALA